MRETAADGAAARAEATRELEGSARGWADPQSCEQSVDVDAILQARRDAERRRNYAAHVIAILIIVIGALDCASTNLALGTGFAEELNPVVAWIQSVFGVYWIWPKMAIHAALAIVLLANPSRPALIAMSCVALLTLLASINNLAIYHAYSGLSG